MRVAGSVGWSMARALRPGQTERSQGLSKLVVPMLESFTLGNVMARVCGPGQRASWREIHMRENSGLACAMERAR